MSKSLLPIKPNSGILITVPAHTETTETTTVEPQDDFRLSRFPPPMLSILGGVILLSFVIALHELGHLIVAKRAGLHVPIYSIGFGPVLLRKMWRGTSYQLAAIPLGGYVSMYRTVEDAAKEGKTLTRTEVMTGLTRPWQAAVLLAGVTANAITAWLAWVALLVFIGQSEPISGAPTLLRIVPGSAAEAAGLLPGDRILSINGTLITSADGIGVVFQKTRAASVQIVRERSRRVGRPDTLRITPKVDSTGVFRIGVQPIPETGNPQRMALGPAVVEASKSMVFAVRFQVEAIRRLAMNFGSEGKSLSGPIGIIQAAGDAVESGPARVIEIFVLISLSVLIFNLLPIPPLDGGQLLWVALGGMARREIPIRIQNRFAVVGLSLLLCLMGWGTLQDVLR